MTKNPVRPLLAFLILACLGLPAWAGLWDYDTLEQEKAIFPSALELITGKFPQHGPDFHRWRIADRNRRLQTDPTHLAPYKTTSPSSTRNWTTMTKPSPSLSTN